MTKEEKQKRREEIIFERELDDKGYLGGIATYSGLAVEKLDQLVTEQLADPEQNQNNSPSLQEFLDFGKKWNPPYTINYDGYMVEDRRDDERVSVDGINIVAKEGTMFSVSFLIDFANMFREADEYLLTETQAKAWFD